MTPELYIGMISGTSRDGADAALVRFNDNWPEVIEADCIPYPPDLAEELRDLVTTGRRPTPEEEVSLDQPLAAHFSRAATALLKKAGVKDIERLSFASPNDSSILMGIVR
jgi:anhydro-N-acetylmuramic acid kinase